MHLQIILLILLGTLISGSVSAADIARDVRSGRQDESFLGFDGYIELSASAILNEIPIDRADTLVGTLSVGGHLRFHRFFLDVYAESYNQFQTGINAYSGSIWSIDILGASSEHGVDSELNTELRNFSDRDPAFFLGGRATGYKGAYIFQFEALSDVSGLHNGSLLTATIGRTWLHRNWNFHALLGARYESAATINYQFGNPIEEATELYPAYTADSGTTFVTEFGISYPFNQYFVFNFTGRWWELPSSIVDSPFINDDSYLSGSATVTFVY